MKKYILFFSSLSVVLLYFSAAALLNSLTPKKALKKEFDHIVQQMQEQRDQEENELKGTPHFDLSDQFRADYHAASSSYDLISLFERNTLLDAPLLIGNSFNCTLLCNAIYWSNTPSVKQLLEKGASVSTVALIPHADAKGRYNALGATLLSKKKNIKDRTKILKLLLSYNHSQTHILSLEKTGQENLFSVLRPKATMCREERELIMDYLLQNCYKGSMRTFFLHCATDAWLVKNNDLLNDFLYRGYLDSLEEREELKSMLSAKFGKPMKDSFKRYDAQHKILLEQTHFLPPLATIILSYVGPDSEYALAGTNFCLIS